MKPATWLLPLLVFASLVSFNTWQRSKTSAAADADLANRIIADALQQVGGAVVHAGELVSAVPRHAV